MTGRRLFAGGVAVLFLGPLVVLAVTAIAERGHAGDVLAASRTWSAVIVTVSLALAVGTAAALLGTVLAWLTVRTDLPGSRAWHVMFALPLAIPSFLAAGATRSALGKGGLVEITIGVAPPQLEGWLGSFVILTLFTFPYAFLPVAARLATLPRDVEEGARLLGGSPRRIFVDVVVPQIADAAAAGGLLAALYTMADFGAVALMRLRTLTTSIFANRLFDPPQAVLLSVLLAAIALAAATADRWLGTRRRVPATSRGGVPVRYSLGAWRAPAVVAASGVVALTLVLPLLVFAVWAWRGIDSGTLPEAGAVFEAAVNSTTAGVAAAVAAMAVALPIAVAAARHREKVATFAATVITAMFALPGLVVAFALVTFVLRTPGVIGLYQTLPLLILAYVVAFGAQALQTTEGAVRAMAPRFEEAARTLGAGRLRRLMTIELPLLLPGLAAGAGLVMLSVVKELPATLLLAPTGFSTLATRIWGAAESAFFAEMGLLSIVLVAVAAVLTWVFVARRGVAP